MKKEFYAHTTQNTDKSDWQTIESHLKETAQLSGNFSEKFGQKELGYFAGLFHDIGKYSEKFQHRLEGANIKVDHSTAGAREVGKLHKICKMLLPYCIAGHHGGLMDTNSLEKRLKSEVEDYSMHKTDLEIPAFDINTVIQSLTPFIEQNDKYATGFSLAFLTRMVYSSLVDADWLNSEEFAEKAEGVFDKNAIFRDGFQVLVSLNEKLSVYLAQFKNSTGEINQARQQIQENCYEKSKSPKGLYTLTVPTGGGKTLSSLVFALNHAIANNQDRVIYTIPYTSIIEQNANVFRKIFNDENVLEHHSNYIFEDKDFFDDEQEHSVKRLKYASENWTAPIIVTTNVQFFESLFSNKKSKCRKLHNIANSVIIMDEAQMIPTDYLVPCIRAIEELVLHYNCTIVLCTATQPPFESKFLQITPTEIISDTERFFEIFKRVKIEKIGQKSDDELANELLSLEQVLTIVNTKKHAKTLYTKLKEVDGVFHLSTFMCPLHRKQKIAEIKERLKNKDLPTRVISTQLIEAGVDIDFPCVYRASAGVDSIAQSAGRCNREGKLPQGIVKVFHSGEHKIRGHLKTTSDIGAIVIDRFEDVLSPAAIKNYFEQLYFFKGEDSLDKEKILEFFEITSNGEELFGFEEASKKFNFIESETIAVVTPFDPTAEDLIEKLKVSDFPKKYLKQLQPYVVNLYKQDFDELFGKGSIENIDNLAFVLRDMSRYDEQEGLIVNKDSEALFA